LVAAPPPPPPPHLTPRAHTHTLLWQGYYYHERIL